MLTIGFVVTPDFPVMSLAALSVFEFANLQADTPLYRVEVISEHGGPVATVAGTTVMTDAFGSLHFDTLIIGGNTRAVPTSPRLLAFLTEAASQSRRIASICTGAFALGDAGLLQDRRVTTHWLFTEELKARFPDIALHDNRLFVIDEPLWTAAGNSAGIDLALAMLERDYGIDAARAVAKTLVIEYRRAGGRPQHSAVQELDPRTDRIQEALSYARRNLASPLSVDDLAGAARLSVRQFSRTFSSETGFSPAKAIEKLRLEAAQLMLEQTQHTIETIAVETGFGDQERMRRAFVRAFGRSPQALREDKKANAVRRSLS